MEKAVVEEIQLAKASGEEKQTEMGVGKEDQRRGEEKDILGNMVGDLWCAILDTKDKADLFRPYLEQLVSTLESVMPVIEDWRRSELELGVRQRSNLAQLLENLRKGEEVVRKCPKVHSWNVIQKVRYSIKLGKLDEYIRGFFNLELQVDIWHDNKQMTWDFSSLSSSN